MFKRKNRATPAQAAQQPNGTMFEKYRAQLDDQIERTALAGAADEAHGAIFDGLVDAWLNQELATADHETRLASLDCERRTLKARAHAEAIRTQLASAEAWLADAANLPPGVEAVDLATGARTNV